MPGTDAKLDILAESARYDVCMSSCSANLAGGSGRLRDPQHPLTRWIYPAHMPGKGQVAVLKILQTNVCSKGCSYCRLAVNQDSVRRVGFSPDELARLFMQMYRRKLVHGIFLSSGVGLHPDTTMGRMIATAELLRKKHGFRDYIHLKILPGAAPELIENAVRIADRVSVNLETPDPRHLSVVAPAKDFRRDLLLRMKWAGDLIHRGIGARSHTTQFVVGAADESDLDILKTVDWIYREMYLFRSYFSAYQPGRDETLELSNRYPALLREHRLYQCDFLMRAYGFRLHEFVFEPDGSLPISLDPKSAWAKMHPETFPVDVNQASEEELLRVPGIGPVSAARIVRLRKEQALRNPADLEVLGAISSRASAFVEFSGKRREPCYQQGRLFDDDVTAAWRTDQAPLEVDKIHRRNGAFGGYPFPGQTGKPLNFVTSRNQAPIVCR